MKFRWTVEYRPTNWVETVSIMVSLAKWWNYGNGAKMIYGNGAKMTHGGT